MLGIPKIYLETASFDFPFVEDTPHCQEGSKEGPQKGQWKVFAEIKEGKFRPFTSKYVISELEATKDVEKTERMKALIEDYGITVVPESDEAERLADVYIAAGIIPKGCETDALHIAIAALSEIDVITSPNFKCTLKHGTVVETKLTDVCEGLKVQSRIVVHNPAESN